MYNKLNFLKFKKIFSFFYTTIFFNLLFIEKLINKFKINNILIQ
ncbi:MAG: hypothetical protein Q8877_02405 [Sweet potato little leaf phytoplasma]|nr:hypothetical protein [Sweet potato little leaf phytoplasma]